MYTIVVYVHKGSVGDGVLVRFLSKIISNIIQMYVLVFFTMISCPLSLFLSLL